MTYEEKKQITNNFHQNERLKTNDKMKYSGNKKIEMK